MTRIARHINARRSRRLLRPRGWLGPCLVVAVALLAPAPASAHFERPFVRQLFGTPGFGSGAEPNGLAVDNEDHLWVGNHLNAEPFELDEFEAGSNALLGSLQVEDPGLTLEQQTPPSSLAIDRAENDFYFTSQSSQGQVYLGSGVEPVVEEFDRTGSFIRRLGPFSGPAVAVDNSSGATGGDVYVAMSRKGIERFNRSGEPADFTGSAGYVHGNAIIGFQSQDGPETPFERGGQELKGIAVDTHGDFFTDVKEYNAYGAAVLEYAPTGLQIAAFTGSDTPGLAGSLENGGFGGLLAGVAVDPLTGDVLVAIDRLKEHVNVQAAVDEFDSQGHFLGQISSAPPGRPLGAAREMAIDSNGQLYVGELSLLTTTFEPNSVHAIDVYEEGHFEPALRLGEAEIDGAGSGELHGAVNPEASLDPEPSGLSECQFELVSEAEYETQGFAAPGAKTLPCSGPDAAEVPDGDSYVGVHAPVAGLSAGAAYRYRLTATTEGVKGGLPVHTEALAFTAPGAPRVLSTGVSGLSSRYAELHAQIDPDGAATSYYFQYLSASEYEADGDSFEGAPYAPLSAPASPAGIGAGGTSGKNVSSVAQSIAGLEPGTVYDFRVLASNEIATVASGAAVFATTAAPVAGLPDGRVYEMVTPSDKGVTGDMFGTRPTNNEWYDTESANAAPSGRELMLATNAAFGAFPAASNNAYLFSRTASGWGYVSLASPSLGVQGVPAADVFGSPDFSEVAFQDAVGSSSEAGVTGTTLVGAPGGPYMVVHADAPFNAANGTEGEITGVIERTTIAGASQDLRALILEARTVPASASEPLCPGGGVQDRGSHVLCESVGGEVRLVDVKPGSSAAFACGAGLGKGGEGRAGGAVSPDGARIVFTAPDPRAKHDGAGCWDGAKANPPQLYMRSEGQTLELSEAQPGVVDPSGRHPAEYVGAAAGDARVFFVSEGELTADDAGIHDVELYEWRAQGTSGCGVSSGCLTRISAGESGHADAAVSTVPAIAAEGRAVYFTAFGSLTAGAPTFQPTASVSALFPVNLYRYDTETGTTSYVATITTGDYVAAGSTACSELGREFSHSTGLCQKANWQTTPDGRQLIFGSSGELTGESTKVAPGARCFSVNLIGLVTGHCEELYRYSFEPEYARGGSLICVSCDPSGAAPVSNALFTRSAAVGAQTVHALSDDGSKVFFDTADPLVANDINGTLDVYEWEADGSGACRAQEGCVSLISSGRDPAPSFFLDASADGADVFFGTHARLVAADSDSAGDVYDARVCTAAEPCPAPGAAETRQCEGGACQTPPPPPNDQTPFSLTSSLPGNLAPPKAGAGKPAARPLGKLARALRACRSKHGRHARARCEAHARARYGDGGKARKSSYEGRR